MDGNLNISKLPIKHLFIIGNGFDLAHGYPTSYNNFRDYLMERFPGSNEYDELVPESTTMPDGDEVYVDEDIAGYISRILDACGGDDWNNLETYLGSPVIEELENDLDFIDPEDMVSDSHRAEKEFRHAVYNNEDRSLHMKRIFPKVKELFCDWIMDYYSRFDYGLNNMIAKRSANSTDLKKDIAAVLKEGDGFINFNYTYTLERVYKIKEDLVCHIHGKVGDANEDIYLGHGEEDSVFESLQTMGAESNLSELKYALYKNTDEAWDKHLDYLCRIGDELVDIHSFGFSFSDVDLKYIKRIAEMIGSDKIKGITWYINRYTDIQRHNGSIDGNKLAEQISKVEDMGFKMAVDNRW